MKKKESSTSKRTKGKQGKGLYRWNVKKSGRLRSSLGNDSTVACQLPEIARGGLDGMSPLVKTIPNLGGILSGNIISKHTS